MSTATASLSMNNDSSKTAAAPSSLMLPSLTPTHGSGSSSRGGTFAAAEEEHDTSAFKEAQLSQDLALFLSNPSLKAALADGSLDLTRYSGQVEEELQELEAACIAVYKSKQAEIEALARELDVCDAVLSQHHEMLLGFQADLGGLSGEIRQLQQKSRTLDVQLKNRRAAEAELRQFLKHVIVSPALAKTVTTGPVNPVFLKCVQELNQMYKDAHLQTPAEWSANLPPDQTVAGQECQVQLSQLRLVAVTRVRDYFLQQLALLRRPQTNIRMIQVHGLLKYAALQDFLYDASPVIGQEIYNVYVESMSKTLQQLFRTYQAQLLQLDSTKTSATRQDVIAIEDAVIRDALTTRAKKRVDVFCLGNRAELCLEEAIYKQQPILAHVALAENVRYPYERLFRSLLGHLVDSVTNEHVFCRQFFKRDAFQPLFHMTLSLLLEQVENYLFGCYDALCLLLMIKVTHCYKRLTRTRKIHSLDAFFDQVTRLLWPRLKTVIEGHLRSLKQASASKLGGVDLHPHYVSRRFAEFCCSILLILHDKSAANTSAGGSSLMQGTPKKKSTTATSSTSSTTTPVIASKLARSPSSTSRASKTEDLSAVSAGEKLMQDLGEMIEEYILLLERLSEEHSIQKKRVVFQINNLDLVVCTFQERRVVVGKEFNRFVELLMHQREQFVEEELLTGFSKMIAFVQQTEAHIATAKGNLHEVVNPQVVEALVIDFASNWKAHMEQINRNVLSYFSNFRNGMEILKQVLTQLLLYYTRFQDIIRKVWRNKPPAFAKDLVGTTVILAEIKKYALSI